MEKQLEEKLRFAIKTRGGLCMKFTSPGRRGVADRVIALPDGRTYWVETKFGRNGLSVHQKNWQRQMTAIGHKVWNLWTDEHLKIFLNYIDIL